MRYIASPAHLAPERPHAQGASLGLPPAVQEATMGALRIFRNTSRALLALCLIGLWVGGLPQPTQGATGSASYQALYAFPQVAAGPPPVGMTPSGLLLGADGNFYGTTYYGGANDFGSVVKLTLDPSSFASWSTAEKAWVVEAGAYALRVGTSSRNLTLEQEVTIQPSGASSRRLPLLRRNP